MRVSNGMMSYTFERSLQTATLNYTKVISQMATGDRMLRPSDDYIASNRVLELDHYQAQVDTYMRNMDQVDAHLGAIDATCSSMITPLDRIIELSMNAGNGTATMEDREAAADELEGILNSLVDMVNTKSPTGTYLFSGNSTDTPPLAQDPTTGEWIYQGDSGGSREVPIGDDITVDTYFSAEDMFGVDGSGTDIFNTLEDTIDMLRDPTVTPSDPAYQAQIQETLDAANGAIEGIGHVQTAVGGEMNATAQMRLTYEDMTLYNDQLRGALSDLDYGQASIDLANSTLALQAVQMTYAQVSGLSLFNYI